MYNYVMDISLSGGRLWAYTTHEIIGRGHSQRLLSQGRYTPITTSRQDYTLQKCNKSTIA